MNSTIELVGNIIRAKTALHLKLRAHRKDGREEIGGRSIDDLIAEVDAGIFGYEQMLVRFKNQVAAEIMEPTEADAEQ